MFACVGKTTIKNSQEHKQTNKTQTKSNISSCTSSSNTIQSVHHSYSLLVRGWNTKDEMVGKIYISEILFAPPQSITFILSQFLQVVAL